MPSKILTIKDNLTSTLLPGATVFSTSQIENNGVLTLVGHADINGNVLINTDDALEYIITALYLTEDNLIEGNTPTQAPTTPTYVVYRKKEDGTTAPDGAVITFKVSGPQKTAILTPVDPNISNTPIESTPSFTATFDTLANTVLGTYKDLLAGFYGSTVFESGKVFTQQNSPTTTAESSPTVKISYYELEAYLTQPPYNQNQGSIARISPADFINFPDDYKIILLQLTPEARASQYWPTDAQIRGIAIVNLPSSNTVTEIPRATLAPEPDVKATSASQLNDELKTENNKTLDRTLKSTLSPQARLVNIFNAQKTKIRRKIIPFLMTLLLPFGAAVVQGVLAKLPLSTLKDLASCPNRAKLLQLIEKRNKLVRQINAIYKTITTLSKIAGGFSLAVSSIRIGILAATFLPLPAPPAVPVGLAKVEELAKKFNVVLNVATVALATIGTLLGVVLIILKSLDALLLQCAEDPNYNTPPDEPLPVDAENIKLPIPFEEIDAELDNFVNESTGLNNSDVIQTTQENNIYKGFTLELKLDTTSNTSYPRRFAQAVNVQGVPVLKTDSSFASDPQVLLDQLKFIIDSNPQLTAE
jgi:hypothetical protein